MGRNFICMEEDMPRVVDSRYTCPVTLQESFHQDACPSQTRYLHSLFTAVKAVHTGQSHLGIMRVPTFKLCIPTHIVWQRP